MDPRTPRDITKRLENDQSVSKAVRVNFNSLYFVRTLTKQIKSKVFWLQSAAQNGTDNLSLVVAAVLLANIANVDTWWANALSGIYIALRCPYIIAYGSGMWKLRSASFWVGQGCLWTLFGMGVAKFGSERAVGGL